MANPVNAMFRMRKYEGGGLGFGDIVCQLGQASFTSTNTTVAVATDLDEVIAAVANPMGGTIDTEDSPTQPATTVSSDTITFTRQAAGTDAGTFSYLVLGRKTS